MHAKGSTATATPAEEEIKKKTRFSPEINVTSNYAPTKRTEITVLDADGSPAEQRHCRLLQKYSHYGGFATIATKDYRQRRTQYP